MTRVRTRITVALAFALVGAITSCASARSEPAAFEGVRAHADSSAVVHIAPGVAHAFVLDRRGPWAVHIIEVDTRVCEPMMHARKPGPPLAERALTSRLAADALAGINADFFMLPGGTPVGAHVSRWVTLIGPTDRPVFGITASGAWRIDAARSMGHARAGDDSTAITQVNRPARAFSAWRGLQDGLTLFTAWTGDSVPADSAARRLLLHIIDGNEAAGRALIAASDSADNGTPLRAGAAVMLAHGKARAWAARRAPGDTVVWSIVTAVRSQTDARGANVLTEVVGGFPELLRDGRAVLGEQTVAASFGAQRHPRTAIGWTPTGRLLLVTVDGRQPDWSAGMSLEELTWLFQSLGASYALNLDGGGSTAMVVSGAVVNRPSDREGERAVGNALVLAGCRPPRS